MIKRLFYGPKLRDFVEQPRKIRTYSERDSTSLPNPVADPIVSNNIVCPEFDYTAEELDWD